MNSIEKGLGCLVFLFIAVLTFLFAKFLVPIVPLIFVVCFFFVNKYFKNYVFQPPQKIKDLKPGHVLLEGNVEIIGKEIVSPYFKEVCVGYFYTEIQYISTDDSMEKDVLKEQIRCEDFYLNTESGRIKIIGKELNLKQLQKLRENKPLTDYNRSNIEYTEHHLRNGDDITIIGTAATNSNRITEIGKVADEPFFATTRSTISIQQESLNLLKKLSPWMLIIYLTVNYFLFFAPENPMPQNDFFTFFSIFGLPILGVLFFYVGDDQDDWFSRLFQYLAGVFVMSSILTFPLVVLFLLIKIAFYRIFCIVLSILFLTALTFIFNSKILTKNRYNQLLKKSS